MDSYTIRAELKRMNRRDLYNLAWQQKERWCNVGAGECGFLIQYKGFGFCLTELLGHRCSLYWEDQAEDKGTYARTCSQLAISSLWLSDLQ